MYIPRSGIYDVGGRHEMTFAEFVGSSILTDGSNIAPVELLLARGVEMLAKHVPHV